MKYIIIKEYAEYVIEADDFEDAFNKAYDNHCGYDNLIAIVRVNEE